MKNLQSETLIKWECKYHVVIIPKHRRKVLYGRIRRQIGEILGERCRQRGISLLEGKSMINHTHPLLSVPPKYSIAYTIGYLKGKSARYGFSGISCERREPSMAGAFGREGIALAR